MSPRDAFKLGFLLCCVEAKKSNAEIAALTKNAAVKRASSALTKAWDAVAGTGGLVLGAGLALPPLLGYHLGAVAGQANSPDLKLSDVERQEVVDEYARLAARIRARLKRKKALQEAGV